MDVSKQMEAIAQFGASLGIVDRAEIPSFHEMGRDKWERYRASYKLASPQEPSGDAINQEASVFLGAALDGF